MGLNLCIEERKKCIYDDEKVYFGSKNKIKNLDNLNVHKLFITSNVISCSNKNINSKIKKYKRKIRILEKQLQ